MDKHRTTVLIAGKEYTLTSYDSDEYVRRVAVYVDRKLSELSLALRLPPAQLAVLTAVNVADDMLKAHDENARLRRELEETRAKLEACEAELARPREGGNG